MEEVPLFGLVFVNHGSVCHGDWFCLRYIFFFHLFVKNRYHVSMHEYILLCLWWPSFWVMGDRDYDLIDSHESSTHTHRVQFVMLPG